MRSLVIALAILTTIGFADTLLLEDFNSTWTTNVPPTGWRIFHTDTLVQGTDDWHRNDSASLPWTGNLTSYAAIYYNLAADATPDTLFSPILDCRGFDDIVLSCSTYFERKFPNPYDAELRYSVDSGVTFPYGLADYYEQSIGPELETFDLTQARNQPGVVIAWIFDGNLADIDWWCLDDVLVEGESIPTWDISCSRIYSPGTRIQPGTMTPLAAFTNLGLYAQESIPVYCTLYDSSGAVLYNWADTLDDSVQSGAWDSLSFIPGYTFASAQDSYYIEFWAAADSDYVRSNDTLSRYFDVSTLEQYRYDDNTVGEYLSWPVGHNGWGVRFRPTSYPVVIETLRVYLRVPGGGNPEHERFQLAIVKANNDGTPGTMYSKTPVLTGSDGWNDVFVADTGEQLVVTAGDFYVFYLQVSEPLQCPELATDAAVSAPDSTFWEYRSGVYSTTQVPGDIKIRVTANTEAPLQPLRDMRALYVEDPLYEFVQRPFDAPVIPAVRVENIGTMTMTNVPVTCSIFDATNTLLYDSIETILSLDSGRDTLVVFGDWVPTAAGRCSVFVRTVSVAITPDLVPENDAKRFTVDIRKGRHSGGTGLPGDYAWIDSDTLDGPVFDWVDTSGANIVISQGSEVPMFVPVWFDFPYDDTTYNNVIVSTNGWLSLGVNQNVTESLPRILPNANPPNAALYPWWDNLAVGQGYGGGMVFYKSEGVAPNRRFVVTWQDAFREGSDTNDLISFQAILNENGTIVYQYQDVTTGDLEFDNARYSAIGIENRNGSDGLCYLYARPPMDAAVNDLENRVAAGRAVRFFRVFKDAAALDIVDPRDYVFEGPVTPRVTVQNYGTVRDTIRAFLTISGTPPYVDSLVLPDVAPGDSVVASLATLWYATLGQYSAKCSVAMTGDTDPTNDVCSKIVVVSPWIQQADIPEGVPRRKVKYSSLVSDTAGKKLYAMKGSVDNTLWCFDIATGQWDTLAPMPLAPTGKRAKDGCDLAFDPDHGVRGTLWAIKGGGRTDFYAYDIDGDSWSSKKAVFIAYLNDYRPPKTGARVEYVPDYGLAGAVYCIPGNNTRFLWRYDIAGDSWQNTKHDVPIDPVGRYRRCKHGSDITYGAGLLYLLKGSNTLECYAYNPLAESAHLAWVDTLDQVSLFGPTRRKVKAGGSMTYHDSTLYVLKGGNTQEFWSYRIDGDTWRQRTDIPIALSGRRRKVKRGSSLAAGDTTLYCLKGSYVYEFWEYKPSGDTTIAPAARPVPREGVMGAVEALDRQELIAYPNPTRSGLTIRYSIVSPAATSVRIYDTAGKLVRTLYDAPALAGSHALRWDGLSNWRRRVAAGVYFVQLESGTTRLTRKLIIQR